MREALATRLTEVFDQPVTLQELARLSGGASRETWAFTARTADGVDRQMVLRSGAGLGGVPLEIEREAMVAAARVGVPVPTIVDGQDADGALGRPYLLMDRLDGETIPRRILRDPTIARPGLVRELGALLARLHAVPLDEVPGVESAGEPVTALWTEYLADGGMPPPGLALGLRWLVDNRPEGAGEVLVHGDFRLGNLMLGFDGVRGVLDWELVHTGDPVEDLGWLCAKVWRFGSPHPAGGMGSREELLDGYAAVAGWRPTPAQLHWWELYATVRWGLMCGVMANRHLSGTEPSVELAAIGRRACEQEFDVLLALGIDQPDTAPPPAPDGDSDLFGRPTAADLADAVAAYLTTDVQPATTGRVSFHARVAANVVAILRREQLLGPDARQRHRAALLRLGCADDPALSQAIGSGTLDDRWADVAATVSAGVRDQLLVANPRHLSVPAGKA